MPPWIATTTSLRVVRHRSYSRWETAWSMPHHVRLHVHCVACSLVRRATLCLVCKRGVVLGTFIACTCSVPARSMRAHRY